MGLIDFTEEMIDAFGLAIMAFFLVFTVAILVCVAIGMTVDASVGDDPIVLTQTDDGEIIVVTDKAAKTIMLRKQGQKIVFLRVLSSICNAEQKKEEVNDDKN